MYELQDGLPLQLQDYLLQWWQNELSIPLIGPWLTSLGHVSFVARPMQVMTACHNFSPVSDSARPCKHHIPVICQMQCPSAARTGILSTRKAFFLHANSAPQPGCKEAVLRSTAAACSILPFVLLWFAKGMASPAAYCLKLLC